MTVFRFLPQKSEGIAAEAMEAEYLHSISRFYIDVRINDLKKEKSEESVSGVAGMTAMSAERDA